MRWYGLENSNIVFEYVPLFSKVKCEQKLIRIMLDDAARMETPCHLLRLL